MKGDLHNCVDILESPFEVEGDEFLLYSVMYPFMLLEMYARFAPEL